jgi:hypothetical protein
MILTGEIKNPQRETCSIATLCATNSTWSDPGTNPGLRGDRPVSDSVTHGPASLFPGNFLLWISLHSFISIWMFRFASLVRSAARCDP